MSPSGYPSDARFICFEGIDGCGKSTLLAYLAGWLEESGIAHITTREPGATAIGEKLRAILLDPASAGMHPWTEVLLYMASRAQHVAEVIRPALSRGLWVLTDRFVDATFAYQGYGRGLGLDRLRAFHEWTTENIWPDCTVLLDCDVANAFERRLNRCEKPDRLEQQEVAFHESVRQGYLQLAAAEPGRFLVLDGGRPLEEVRSHFRTLLAGRFPALRS